jgi:hypothetical protein
MPQALICGDAAGEQGVPVLGAGGGAINAID